MTNVNKSIQSLNKSFRSGEAFSLLGKRIIGYDPSTGTKIEGNVTGLFYKGDDIKLIVNNMEISLNNIYAVYANSQSDIKKSEQ